MRHIFGAIIYGAACGGVIFSVALMVGIAAVHVARAVAAL